MDVMNFDNNYSIDFDAHATETAHNLLQDVQLPVADDPRRQPDTPFEQARRRPDVVQTFGSSSYSTWNYPDGTREVRFIANVNNSNSFRSLTRYDAAGRIETEFTASTSFAMIGLRGLERQDNTCTVSRGDGSVRTFSLHHYYSRFSLTGNRSDSGWATESFRDGNGKVRDSNTGISYDLAKRQRQEILRMINR